MTLLRLILAIALLAAVPHEAGAVTYPSPRFGVIQGGDGSALTIMPPGATSGRSEAARAGDEVNGLDFSSFAAAAAQAISSNKVLRLPPGSYSYTSGTVLTVSVPVIFEPGAVLTCTGADVAFTSELTAARWQIFAPGCTPTFSPFIGHEIYFEWWGPTPTATGSTVLTANTAAFNAWYAQVCAAGYPGTIAPTTYHLTAGVTWDFLTCPYGARFLGASHGRTVLDFDGSATAGWQWKISGGTGPSNTVPHVFDEMGNLTITCNASTVCWKLGQDNGADVFESSSFHDMYVSNLFGTGRPVAVRINAANANTVFNIQTGVTPATGSSVGLGVGLQITMAGFNHFSVMSVGNAETGIEFTDLGNSAIGFSYGNTFNSTDIENTCHGIILANSANSATTKNTFTGGQMYTIGPVAGACPLVSNQMASPSLPDGNLIFENVNFGSNLPYGGTTQPFWDTIGPRWAGIRLVGSYTTASTYPSAPGTATGCSTNLLTNKSGQTQRVTITGTFTAFCLNGWTYSFASGGNLVTQIQADPGDTYGVQYTGGAPQFFIQPLTH